MAKDLTPQMAIDELVMHRMNVLFHPTWDGAAWVLTPAEIQIEGLGNVGVDGNNTASASILLTADTLPMAGQTALTSLYNHVEQLMADAYPP